MPYGTIKVDTITFTDGGVDKSVAISGLVQNPTFSGNITATGTISGNIIQGGTTVSGLTVTGTTANFASGVFTTQISGAIVKVPAGTAGAPSLQVGTGTSVAPGLYGAGTDQIGISTGGSSVVVLDSVGQLRVVNAGTAAAPAVIVGNDLNSGLYSPGADQVAISTGGVQRLVADANGRFGFSGAPTNGYGATFHAAGGNISALIASTGANAQLHFRDAGTGGNWPQIGSLGDSLVLRGGNVSSENARIDSSGRLLVGTSIALNTANHDARVQFAGTTFATSTTSLTSYAADDTGAYLHLAKARGGNVGNTTIVQAGDTLGSIRFCGADGTDINQRGAQIDCLVEGTPANNSVASRLVFSTTADGAASPTERMRIDSSGRMLLGSTSASGSARLIVKGASGDSTGEGRIHVSAGTATPADGTNLGRLIFSDQNDGSWGGTIAFARDGGTWTTGASHPTRMVISTATNGSASPTERMRITSDGKVGIGTSSPVGALDVAVGGVGPARVILSQASDNPYIDFYRSDGVSGFTGARINNPSPSLGALAFFTSSNNVAIGSHTFTERARIDTSGRLLVGTSSSTSIGGNNCLGQFETTQFGVLSARRNVAGAAGPGIALSHSRGATSGSYAALTVNDEFGGIYFYGADGTQDVIGASIVASVDGTPGTNDMPGRLVFATTADGASSSTERMVIKADGKVGIGTASPQNKLHVLDATTSPVLIESSNASSVALFKDSGTGGNYPFVGSNGSALILRGGNVSSENARIDAFGRLLVGTSTARSNFFNASVTSQLQVEGTTTTTSSISCVSNNASGNNAGIFLAKSNGAAVGSNTIISNGDVLGGVYILGSDGSEFVAAAQITAEVDGAPGANDMPGRLVFATTADGAASPTERMRITSDGKVGIGSTSPSARLDVTGDAYIGNGTADSFIAVNTSGSDTANGNLIFRGGGAGNPSAYLRYERTTQSLVYLLGNFGSPTERLRIDSSGRLLVGTSTARTGDGVTPRYFQEGAITYEAIGVCSNGGTTANRGAYLFLSRSRGTTNGSSTIVADGDIIGGINFYGADGTDIDTAAAYISCAVDGTPGTNDMPGRLVFSTTADGANTPTERMRIDSSGRVGIGLTTARSNFINGTVSSALQVEGAGGASPPGRFLSITYGKGGSNNGPYIILAKHRSDFIGGITAVAANDFAGHVSFTASDGTNFLEVANIHGAVDGTPGLNDMPGRLVFSTTADGASSPTEAMRINNQRELLIGTTTRTANGGVLQVSNGITFPGTQSACSDPNTLDDYEEGTWTVTFYDANTAGNASSTTATGDYTKVGNTVRATFSIDNINTTGLTAGNIFTFTLPFTHAGTYESAGSCAFASVTLGAGYTGLTSFIPANATRGYFLAWGNNIAFGNAPVSYFNNGAADLRVTITYKAA